MAKVVVAVTNCGDVRMEVAAYLLYLERNKLGHTVDFEFPVSKPIRSNRNAFAYEFLQAGYDYLFFMDSDNPPLIGKNPLELIELDKDILVLPTPVFNGEWENPFLLNCYDKAPDGLGGWVEHEDQEGLQEIDVGGTGCMIIARRVLETLAPVPFKVGHNEHGVQVFGEDFAFCCEAREAGFTIWAHYDYPCQHFKSIDLLNYHLCANRQKERKETLKARAEILKARKETLKV